MTELLRLYDETEAGGDGYPLAWSRCPGCGGTGHEAEAIMDSRNEEPVGEQPAGPCRVCDGSGSIKDLIRELAGNRCVRCFHPYEKGGGEWSSCEPSCQHKGPIRVRYGSGEWREYEEVDAGEQIKLHPEMAKRSVGRVEVQARWRILTVHHLDGDKLNCRWWNLAALCQRDHLSVQSRVVMAQVYADEHSPWFKLYAAGYYAWCYLGEELSREQAESRLDELLALERSAA